MSTPSPSPSQTTQRRRRDGLIWLIILALLLAILPIGCIAEVALRLVAPRNDPFKDVGSSSSLGAYAPFPPGISFAAVNPDAPNVRATEVSRREHLTPVTLQGAITVAPIAEVGPPVAQIVPPTATVTTPPTPRPTVTPGPPPPDVAGGVQPSPTATQLVLIPGVTATPEPTATATRTPTRTPAPEVSATATRTPPPLAPSATAAIIASPAPATATPATATPATATPATATPSATAAILPSPTLTPRPPPSPTPTDAGAPPTPTEPPPIVPSPTAPPTEPPTETPAPPPTATSTPEPPTPELFINAGRVTEGGPGETPVMTFTVGLSAPVSGPVSVRYTTIASAGPGAATPGSDFAAFSDVLIFVGGEQVKTISVPIVGDAIVESDETFIVQLSGAVGAVIAVPSATGTIVDDDLATVRFTTAGPLRVIEGAQGTTTTVTVDVAVSGQLERNVTVAYATQNDSAVGTGPAADFQARSGTLTFTPGGPATLPVAVTIVGDNVAELDEQFLINLVAGAGYLVGSPGSVAVIIENDDLAAVSIGGAPVVVEGDTGQVTSAAFTISLVGVTTLPVTVTYATVDDTATSAGPAADYQATSGTVVFSPGGATSAQVLVPVVGDDVDEIDERFFVRITGAVNATVNVGQAQGIIDDDDGPTVSVSSPGALEGDPGPAGVLQFAVQPSAASPQDVVVRYQIAGASATAGVDFTAPATVQTITFPATALGDPQPAPVIVSVPVIADPDVENDETLTLTIVEVVDGFAGPPGTGTILNDDLTFASLSVGRNAVDEGDAGATLVNVAVTLTKPAPATLSFDLSTAGSATAVADFTLSPARVSIPAGQLTGSASLSILGDTLVEGNETVAISLAVAPGMPAYARLGAPTSQTVTIIDDDRAAVTIGPASLIEGDAGTANMTFQVTISPVPLFPATISWTTQATGSAAADVDYQTSAGTVTLGTVGGAPVAQGQISVPIVGDLLIEGDETFQVLLTGASSPLIDLPGPATGTIVDDDAVGVIIGKAGSSPGEPTIGATVIQDDAVWVITVNNTSAAAVSLVVTDSLSGIAAPYTLLPIYSNPGISFGGTGGSTTSVSPGGEVVTWSGTLNPGGQVNIQLSAVVEFPATDPPSCDTTGLTNPSYTVVVDGLATVTRLNTAPAPVGAGCPLTPPAPVAAPLKLGSSSARLASVAPVIVPTATPTALPTPTATPTLTPTSTPQPTDEPTATPTDEPTATATSTRTPTRTPAPTDEPTATATSTRTPTRTPAPTDEPTATATSTPTAEPTRTPRPTSTRTPTAEPTATVKPTSKPTAEPTSKPTAEPTDTPEPTSMPAPTDTPEPTSMPAPTDTPEPTEEPAATEGPGEPRPPYPAPGDLAPPSATSAPPSATSAPPPTSSPAAAPTATSAPAPAATPQGKEARPAA